MPRVTPVIIEVWEAKLGTRTATFRIALPMKPFEIVCEAKKTMNVSYRHHAALTWGVDRGELVFKRHHKQPQDLPTQVLFMRRISSTTVQTMWNFSA